jgi:pimeloyl-ACP methyl ester carboxylesterase
MRPKFHAWFVQLLDEVAANILLHNFLWYRRHPPASGPRAAECPGLYSGEPAEFYSPVPAPMDLDADRLRVHETASATVSDFRFDSETVTAWPENDRAWGRHWKTKAPDRGLTVVGVDGIVQLGTRWFRRLARELSPRGVDVVTMDAPFNYRRTPAGYRPGQLIVSGDMAHQLAVTRQAVLDLWKLIVSLQAAGRRVGLVGVSYGGWITLLTSLLTADLEFLIAVVPPVDITSMLREGGTIVRSIRRGIGHAPLERLELERLAKPVVPLHWPSALPGHRISLHAARYDRLAPCHGIEKLAQAWQTRLTLHSRAHFQLANSTSIFPQIADEVCDFAFSPSAHAVVSDNVLVTC